MADRQEGRSSEEIRRDIDGTRAEMHETVDALERKLSPGQLVDELWGRFGGGRAVSSVGSVVRDHPVPLALMGLGVAWLAIEKGTGSEGDRLRSRHGSVDPGTHDRAEGRVGPYHGDEVTGGGGSRLEEVKEKATAATEKVKAKATAAKEKASGAVSGAGERASGSGRALQERAEGGLDRAREQARHRGRQATRGFRLAMEEQPLAMGAVAFGLGLAGGLAAPGTRLEDRAMGGAADAVKGEARRATKDAAESGKRVAKDAARAAKEEADRQGVAATMKDSARRVAEEAKETAGRRAREEDLDPEGMKKRAAEAKETAGRRARDDAGGSS